MLFKKRKNRSRLTIWLLLKTIVLKKKQKKTTGVQGGLEVQSMCSRNTLASVIGSCTQFCQEDFKHAHGINGLTKYLITKKWLV